MMSQATTDSVGHILPRGMLFVAADELVTRMLLSAGCTQSTRSVTRKNGLMKLVHSRDQISSNHGAYVPPTSLPSVA